LRVVVERPGFYAQPHASCSRQQSVIEAVRGFPQSTKTTRLPPTTARPAQSSEPILVPKLRISLADFPYLHFSIDQRLFTLETCCGYRVRPSTRITPTHSDFQGPAKALWTPQEPRCFTDSPPLSPGKPISGARILTKKRQLSPGLWPTSLSSFASPLVPPKRHSPCLGSGILTGFPFAVFHVILSMKLTRNFPVVFTTPLRTD
jgi:hypothetical protein